VFSLALVFVVDVDIAVAVNALPRGVHSVQPLKCVGDAFYHHHHQQGL
jgi:hypothetical protein